MASRDQHRHVCVTSLALAVSVPAEGACLQTTRISARIPPAKREHEIWSAGNRYPPGDSVPCEAGSAEERRHRGKTESLSMMPLVWKGNINVQSGRRGPRGCAREPP